MNDTNNQNLSRRNWLGIAVPAVAASVGTGLLGARAMADDQPAATDAGDKLLGAKIYNIRDFGAIGDGKALDTVAVQAAIDACHKDLGGTVLVPAGTFVIGTVELKSNVTLHIAAQGKLQGTLDAKQYFAAGAIPLKGDSTLKDGNVGLIFAVNAENITVEGPGTIDGQGAQFHSPKRGEPSPVGLKSHDRPYHLLFYQCKNLRVRDIFLKDCAYHSIRVIQSSYAWFGGIHIHNRVNGNNDGFHFISCQYVHVTDCDIQCQDDACALFGSCKFVTVTNSTFSTRWSVFRFGGGSAENITVSNCVIFEAFGCPIKMQCGPNSRFENMAFSNLVMKNVTGPISIGLGPEGKQRRRSDAQDDEQTNLVAGATSALGANAMAGADSGMNTNSSALAVTNLYAPQPADPETGTNEPPPFVPVPDPEDLAKPPGICRNISFNGIHAVVSKPAQLSDETFENRYNPGEIFSCIALNGVAPAFLEDISFNDVHVIFPGGGTAEQGAVRAVPKIADEYFRLGVLPAYAFFARNVRGLTLSNVRFEIAASDLRPAVVFDHVQDAAVNGLNVQGDKDAESVLRFIDSLDVLMSATRLLKPAAIFLQVEGAENGNITIDGGDISKAAAPLVFKDGAKKKSVKLRS